MRPQIMNTIALALYKQIAARGKFQFGRIYRRILID